MIDDLHSVWHHRWLNSKVKSFTSEIHGLGAKAIDCIKKGETVAVLGGVIIHKNDMPKYWQKMGQVGIQIDDNFFICPTSRKELEETAVFNHSCNPNCGFNGILCLVAIRDIQAGEELTFEYAMCETLIEPFDCGCCASTCRKKVCPEDWKGKELQTRFERYFSPYVRAKFKP